MFRPRTRPTEPQEKINGTVARILYQGDGFAILRLTDSTVVKGAMTNPAVGLEYIFHGNWMEHERWGHQFAFVAYHSIAPRDFEALAAYLDAHAKWIGPETARLLVDTYGQDTLRVLKDEPERVAREIRGLTLARAQEVSEMLLENEAEEALQIALNELFVGTGISKWIVTQAIKKWGTDAPARISANPFVLTDLSGCGFLLADRVRAKLGIAHDAPERIQAGILHVLHEAAWGEGHTYLPACKFLAGASQLLGVLEQQVATQATSLERAGSVAIGDAQGVAA